MADGRVEIKFLTNTKELETAKKSVENLGASLEGALQDKNGRWRDANGRFLKMSESSDNATQSVSELTQEVKKLNNQPVEKLPDELADVEFKAEKASGGIKSMVTSLGLLKVAGLAISAIRDNLDKAIDRVDTMRQFPRMMQAVGFSASQSEQAISKLSAGIDGLPTALDEVVATTQQLALTTGDLEQATELTLALNNAFLASGSTSADASRGLQQFSQMLSAGKVDMQSWRTLLETMPLALQTVAENMGYVGASAKNDLYDALQKGEKTFDEFSQALIRANEAQGGFAELAKVNSEGIATSFTNIRTAVVKGVADAVIALDELVESVTGKNIAQHADTLKVSISTAFKTINESIRSATPFVQSAVSLFQRATPIVTGLVVAFASFKILTSVTSWFKTLNTAVTVLNSTQTAQIGVTKALSLANVSASGTQKVLAMAINFFTGNVTTATTATSLFNSVISSAAGPIGIAVTALGLFAGAAIYLKNKFDEATEGLREHKKEIEAHVTESQNLQTEIENSGTAFDEQITDIDNNEGALKRLTDRLIDLAKKEEKSGTDKALLQGYVDDLNSSVEGLNLSYDAEKDALNLTKRAIYEKIDAMSDLARANLAYDRMTEIMKEQVALQGQIDANMVKLQELNSISAIDKGQHESIKQLVDETKDLIETQALLGDELTAVEAIYSKSMSSMVTTAEDGTERMTVAYQDMSDAQKAVIDELTAKHQEYRDIATDMFDQIETESETKVADMIANLQHNQEALATYADNMTKIRDAVAELDPSGEFLSTLEALGPEAAGEVANIAGSIGTEDFATLVETFTAGGEEATNALLESLGLEGKELPEGLTEIISEVELSISDQIEASELDQVGKIIFDKIGEGLEGAEGELEEAFKAVFDEVDEWTEQSIVDNNPKEPIENMFEGIEINNEPVQQAMEETKKVIDSSQSDMHESGEELIDAVTDGIESGTPELIQQEQSSIEQAVEVFDEFMDEAYDGGSRLMDESSSGIDSGAPAVAESSRSSAVGGVSAFRNGGGGAFGAGLNLGLGFRNGLESARQQIVSTASSIATAATNAINSALRVASPSKEGIYSGSMLGQGVAVGLDKEKSLVEKEAKELAKLAIPDFGSYDLNRILSFPTLTERTVSSGSNSGQVVDMSRTNELLERIYQKNPNLVADDGAIIGRYTNMFDRENGIIARNKSGRRLN